jgi:uncharacterized integral membrane protein
MKLLTTLIASLFIAIGASAQDYTDYLSYSSDGPTVIEFIAIAIVVWVIFIMLLILRLWRLCDNVKALREHFCTESKKEHEQIKGE